MITREDRAKYPDHTDKSILGIKLVSGLHNKTLRAYIKGSTKIKCAMIMLMGEKTNPNWIRARIADEMLLRDMIDETEHDKLTA